MKVKYLLLPNISFEQFKQMLVVCVAGALIAGLYGIIHDQITYTISPEYFTKLKFYQFEYVDFGLPNRAFVLFIGFLATWWVGFISAWIITRIAFTFWRPEERYRRCTKYFSIVLVSGITGGLVGYVLGVTHSSDYSYWLLLCQSLNIADIPSFASVALIHSSSYLGALAGLGICVILLVREKFGYRSRSPRNSTAD